jgi:hypothetical protein
MENGFTSFHVSDLPGSHNPKRIVFPRMPGVLRSTTQVHSSETAEVSLERQLGLRFDATRYIAGLVTPSHVLGTRDILLLIHGIPT